MNHRTTCSTAFRAKALVSIVVLALVCLCPRASVAQDTLPIQWLYSPISQVNSVAYSPDGTLMAVGGNGGIQIRNATTGALLKCIPTACSVVYSVAFSPDGKTLADGGFNYVPNHDYVPNGMLELWNVSTGTLIYSLNTAANFAVYSVAFSPDGKTLADGGLYVDVTYSAGVLELWSVSTGTLITTLNTANAGGVSSIAFSPDGKTLADGGGVGGGYGVVELWNVSAGTLITTLNTGSSAESIESVTFSPDGKTLAVGGYNPSLHNGIYTGVLELWDVSTGTLIRSLYSLATTVYSVAFSADGKTLADGGIGRSGGVVELWNVSTGKTHSLNTAATTVYSVTFSPDGNTLADGGGVVGGLGIGVVELWNASTDKQTHSLNTTAATTVSSVAFSPDGKTLAVGGYSYNSNTGVVELWSVSTGTLITTLNPANGDGVSSVAFSPDGTTLAVGVWNYSPDTGVAVSAVELWNVSTGTLNTTLSSAALFVSSVAFSPDGKTLADGGYGGTPGYPAFGVLELWKVSAGTLSYSLNLGATSSTVNSVAFSPDGKTLADGGWNSNNAGYTGVVELRNAATGKLMTALPTATSLLNSVAFSPDGKTLADGGYAVGGLGIGVLELWNASTGARLTSPSLVPGTHSVSSVAFSPDGQVLFAGTGLYWAANLQAFSMVNYRLLSYYDQGTEGSVVSVVVSVAVSSNGSLLAYGTNLGAFVLASNPYYNVTVPAPTSLSPNSAKEGGAAFTLTVKGSGFVSGSTVNWNRVALTTTFVSSKQVTASVPASDIASSGTASVTVENPGNVVSNALTFTIQAMVPTLTSLSPGSTTAGGADFTLTVNGNHFVSGATVNWNGAALTTTFVSSTQLTALVPAANIASPGTASVTATNPGTAASNALTFTINSVNNPKPVLSSMSPSSVKHGSNSLTLTLTGKSFLSDSVVNWTAGGTTTALATTYVSSTQLTATVTSDLLAAAGTASVTVFNPAPGGGASGGKKFVIR